MSLKAHEREVMYADLIVRRRGEQAPFAAMSSLVDLWAEAKNTQLAPKTFEKGTVTAIILDYDLDLINDTFTILISIADTTASDPTFADHAARVSRVAAKGPNEGHAYSAHVVLSLIQRTDQPQTYPCLIERVPTLSTWRLQSILNDVISRFCAKDPTMFTFKGAGGQKTPKPYVPSVLIAPIASAEFHKDVEEGKINGLKLSSPASTAAGVAMGPFLTLREESLSIGVDPKIPVGQRWSTILQGVKTQAAQFSKARLYLYPPGASSATSIEFDTSTGQLLGEAYARKRRIGPLQPLLQNGSDKIATHLETEMLKLLKAEM